LLAEFPRQLIYALFVYDILQTQMKAMDEKGEVYDSQFIKFFAAIYTYYDVQVYSIF
jgi:hypothetical protein